MRRTLVAIGLVGATLALAPISVEASGPVRIGLGGGLSVPVGQTADVLRSGFNLRGLLDFNLPALPFGLRGALGYQKFNLEDLASTASSYQNGTSQVLSGLGGVTFPLVKFGPVQPYLLASLGAFHVKGEVDSLGTQLSAQQTRFGVDGGVGVRLGVGRVRGFAEARLENAFTEKGWNPVFSSIEQARLVPITFGVTF